MSNRRSQRNRRKAKQQASNTTRQISFGGSSGYYLTGSYHNANSRTDMWSVGGYPDTLTFDDHWKMFRRNGIAQAVIQKPVEATWQDEPQIFEGEPRDDGTRTRFERLVDTLISKYHLLRRLQALDMRQRVGRYGGLVIVAREPQGTTSKNILKVNLLDALVKLIPVFESQIEVNEWDQDITSVDYGNPLYYQYRSQVPGTRSQGDTQEQTLHPSRVVAYGEGADDGTIYGVPALEACYNALIDCEKVRIAGAEGYLRAAKQRFGLKISDDKIASLLRDGTKKDAFDANLEAFQKGFDNSMLLYGMDVQQMNANLADPTNPWTIALNEICAAHNIPKTILLGFETGERSSEENFSMWAQTINSRRQNEANEIIITTLNHFVSVGLLPKPKADITIEWPDMMEPSQGDKLALAERMASVNEKAFRAGGMPVFTSEEQREIAGFEAEIEVIEDEGGEEDEDDSMRSGEMSDRTA